MAHCPVCDEDHDDISICGGCEDPEINRLSTHIEELRGLVKKAFFDGYLDGFHDGEDSGQSVLDGGRPPRATECWNDSDIRKMAKLREEEVRS